VGVGHQGDVPGDYRIASRIAQTRRTLSLFQSAVVEE
jgi:hypothetical protein